MRGPLRVILLSELVQKIVSLFHKVYEGSVLETLPSSLYKYRNMYSGTITVMYALDRNIRRDWDANASIALCNLSGLNACMTSTYLCDNNNMNLCNQI